MTVGVVVARIRHHKSFDKVHTCLRPPAWRILGVALLLLAQVQNDYVRHAVVHEHNTNVNGFHIFADILD